MKQPKIRFKGFEGEWKENTIGNLGSVSMCKRIFKHQTSSNDAIPFYKIGTFGSTADAFISRALFEEYKNRFSYPRVGDILLSAAGTIGRIVEYKGEESYFQDSNIVWVDIKHSITNPFLKHVYSIIKWSGLEGSTIRRLYNNNILETKIHYPSLEEQQSIASFFTTLDTQISAATSRLASLKQMKAASLQAMFPQEGETTPRVRFKGFEGEWETVKLNSFAKRVTRKNTHQESTLALTIASAYGLVSQIEYFNNLVIGSNISNYYLLKRGEFAYNKSYSSGFPYGSVKRLDRYEQGILSTLYITFRIDNSISSYYLTHFFDTTLWHREVAERAAEGARNHGLLNIGAEDFLDINIKKPKSIIEQQKIADYFSNLDRQITLQAQRIEKLKQIKAACLNNMFV